MRPIAAVLALLVLAVPAAPARAEERASTRDAELLVRQAVAFLKREGKAKAFEAFSDPKGPFTYRDLYVMVYDLEGKCVAHGAQRARIGKSLIEDRDADGKQFVKERVKLALEHGKGWQDYKFLNPVTKQIEQKIAYVERVGDVIVASGAYKR